VSKSNALFQISIKMQLQATTKLCYISGDLMLTGRVWVAKRRLYSWRVTAQM